MIDFEIRDRDLLARIGRFKTKSGTVETPIFLPVINPAKGLVTPRELWETFKCRALITNAYILKRQYVKEDLHKGIHSLLDFPGVIMTDSGAYQILIYGEISVSPEEIIRLQEEVDTDIATILDIPTGWRVPKEHAYYTVDETLKRARSLENLKTRGDIAWVGPVQGGRYLELVAQSAQEMGRLPFQIHALGSPTPIMEQYLFSLLVDMILAAKRNLPPDRPFHLFGAGHPFMFSLAIALGCDLFDSAAYSIFAREDRYMTVYGTIKLDELGYLPCCCPVCTKNDLGDLRSMPKGEREKKLNEHNLYVCFSEINRIKQAITEMRLWEYLEMRAYGHPALLQALKHLRKDGEYIEQESPVTKKRGIFFLSSLGLARPEVIRYKKRLFNRYSPPKEARILLLLPNLRMLPRRSRRYKRALSEIHRKLGDKVDKVHICMYAPPFGVVPLELSGIYPLSQCELAFPPDLETTYYIVQQIVEFIERMRYERVILLVEGDAWEETLSNSLAETCGEKGLPLKIMPLQYLWREDSPQILS